MQLTTTASVKGFRVQALALTEDPKDHIIIIIIIIITIVIKIIAIILIWYGLI